MGLFASKGQKRIDNIKDLAEIIKKTNELNSKVVAPDVVKELNKHPWKENKTLLEINKNINCPPIQVAHDMTNSALNTYSENLKLKHAAQIEDIKKDLTAIETAFSLPQSKTKGGSRHKINASQLFWKNM